MGSGPSLPQDVHVVIIGGGYAGSALALALQKKGTNFTLVDPKDAMHHNVASVRAVAQADFAPKCFIPYAETFGTHFVQGKLINVDPAAKKVELEGGKTLDYSVLVLATGTHGPLPFKTDEVSRESAIAQTKEYQAQVEKAESITIIGGGAVGCEVGPEIAHFYPNKKVTIIHNQSQLVAPGMAENFYKKVQLYLDQMKITIMLDENVANLDELEFGKAGDYTITTEKGSSVQTNLIIKCTGLAVNSEGYATSLGAAVDERGRLKVGEYLQVEGLEDVYALGDICGTTDPRLAYVAGEQAKLLAQNLAKKANNKAMKPWVPNSLPFAIALAMGPKHAVGQLTNGWMVPEFLLIGLKAKDLMVNRFWKDFNQKVPS